MVWFYNEKRETFNFLPQIYNWEIIGLIFSLLKISEIISSLQLKFYVYFLDCAHQCLDLTKGLDFSVYAC